MEKLNPAFWKGVPPPLYTTSWLYTPGFTELISKLTSAAIPRGAQALHTSVPFPHCHLLLSLQAPQLVHLQVNRRTRTQPSLGEAPADNHRETREGTAI